MTDELQSFFFRVNDDAVGVDVIHGSKTYGMDVRNTAVATFAREANAFGQHWSLTAASYSHTPVNHGEFISTVIFQRKK